MASAESNDIKVLYKGWIDAMLADPDVSLDVIRKMCEHYGDVTGEPGSVDYIEVDANGVQSIWAIPKESNENRALLCTHGGGYVVGSMYTHRKMFAHIAKEIGCPALIVHYRRAPEDVHPGPVNDCVNAYKWLLNHKKLKPENIAFTGESAGGGLAITTMLCARENGLPLPAASMPMSPWIDMEVKGKSVDTNEDKDYLVKRWFIEFLATTFLGEKGSKKDPLANPLYADLRGLPPLYIQVGEDETLLDDSRRVAERASAAGVDVKVDIFPEMQHAFQFLVGNAPEADQAVKQMADWVRPKLNIR